MYLPDHTFATLTQHIRLTDQHPSARYPKIGILSASPILTAGVAHLLIHPENSYQANIVPVTATNSPPDISLDLLIYLSIESDKPDWLGPLSAQAVAQPNRPILVLAPFETPDRVRHTLLAGIQGVAPLHCTTDELLQAVQYLLTTSERYVHRRLLNLLLTDPLPKQSQQLPKLTRQERAVLNLIGQALETKEIAARLFVEISTIDSHRKSLLRKFNVRNVVALALLANRYAFVNYGQP